MTIVLASSSPRRKELLSAAGVDFKIIVEPCDETPYSGEVSQAMVERLALAKAHAVASKNPDAYVIGADTTVCVDGAILGKPSDHAEANTMLQTIQGRWHEVWGGIAVVHLEKKIQHIESHISKVEMAPISTEQISWYIKTGEPMDKAGSYAIQGLGLQFVERVDGSYSNVVGLNISSLMRVLRSLGAL